MHRHLQVQRIDDATVVQFLDSKISGELAVSTLGGELYTIVNRPDCQKLVLDFSGVIFLASAMLGKLVAMNRKMAENGGTLRLCELCENIRRIFKYTQLDTIFDIRDTQADAVRA